MKRLNPNLSRIFNSIWIRIQIFTKNHVFHKDIFGEDFVKNNEFKILFSWKTEFRFWIQTMLLKDVATFKFWIRVYPRFGSEFRTALYWESECNVGLLELFMHLGWVVCVPTLFGKRICSPVKKTICRLKGVQLCRH